jgi:hypothetical protein
VRHPGPITGGRATTVTGRVRRIKALTEKSKIASVQLWGVKDKLQDESNNPFIFNRLIEKLVSSLRVYQIREISRVEGYPLEGPLSRLEFQDNYYLSLILLCSYKKLATRNLCGVAHKLAERGTVP